LLAVRIETKLKWKMHSPFSHMLRFISSLPASPRAFLSLSNSSVRVLLGGSYIHNSASFLDDLLHGVPQSEHEADRHSHVRHRRADTHARTTDTPRTASHTHSHTRYAAREHY
jgi:hypothetical protein